MSTAAERERERAQRAEQRRAQRAGGGPRPPAPPAPPAPAAGVVVVDAGQVPEGHVPGQLELEAMPDVEVLPEVPPEVPPETPPETPPGAAAGPAGSAGEVSSYGDLVRSAFRPYESGEVTLTRVEDAAAAAGARMRAEQEARGGKAPTAHHGHGWLNVEAFTEHLRTARFRPLDESTVTVNVRVSASLGPRLEAYLGEHELSKRVVVESLLLELLGPPATGGGGQ